MPQKEFSRRNPIHNNSLGNNPKRISKNLCNIIAARTLIWVVMYDTIRKMVMYYLILTEPFNPEFLHRRRLDSLTLATMLAYAKKHSQGKVYAISFNKICNVMYLIWINKFI